MIWAEFEENQNDPYSEDPLLDEEGDDYKEPEGDTSAEDMITSGLGGTCHCGSCPEDMLLKEESGSCCCH